MISLMGAGAAYAQPVPVDYSESGRFGVRYFGQEAYGAAPNNWDVAQDDQGLIYVGNGDGVLVYDGERWQIIRLPGSWTVRSLTRGPDGRIYVGGVAQLGYLAPDSLGSLRYESLLDEVPESQRDFGDVWHTLATSEGVYFMTHNYLFRWASDGMHAWEAGARQSFWSAHVVRDTLYAQQGEVGLSYAVGDSLRLMPTFVRRTIIALLAADDGMFAVTGYDGIWHCRSPRSGTGARPDTDACRPLPTDLDDVLRQGTVYTAGRLRDGTLAIGLDGGGIALLSPDGRLLRRIDERDGLSNTEVMRTFIDREDNLWLALYDGIAHIDVPSPWSTFSREEGLPSTVYDITRHRGWIYAATSLGLYVLHPDSSGTTPAFTRLSDSEEYVTCWEFAVVDEDLFVACSNALGRIDGERVETAWQSGGGLVALEALRASQSEPSTLFVGTTEGLFILRLADGRVEEERLVPAGRSVHSIVEVPREPSDSHATLWLVTDVDGVVRVEVPDDGTDVSITPLGEEQGVPKNALRFDWVGGSLRLLTRAGLRRLETEPDGTPRFVPDDMFGPRLGETTESVSLLQFDTQGNLWSVVGDEVVVLRPQPDGTYAWDTGTAHRMSSNRTDISALYPEADGMMWAASSRGVIRYEAPARQPAVEPEVRALVRRVSTLDGDSLLFGGHAHAGQEPTVLMHGHSGARFAVAAPVYDQGEGITYRFRLDGSDAGWSGWTSEAQKDYTNLPGGRYTFRVQAHDAYGRLSQEDHFSFSVLPPWYRTPWAYLLWGVLTAGTIALLAYGYSRFRTRRLKSLNRMLARKVTERTEEILLQKAAVERANEELSRTNHSLEERGAQLRQALEENKEILGITAHDLKNPLSGIIGLADVLVEDAADGPAAAQRSVSEFAPMLKGEAEHMLKIIRELLDKHRNSGSAVLAPERVDLNDLVKPVLNWNRPQAEQKDIRLHFDREDDVPVEVDALAIQRVIDNLVSNAVKYSPMGASVWIEVSAAGPSSGDGQGRAVLTVRDEGPGLTEEDRAKVFGRLQRLSAKPTAGEHSTGLGLYIVKQLVEEHGGAVEVESAQGQGATFRVLLPLVPPLSVSDPSLEP